MKLRTKNLKLIMIILEPKKKNKETTKWIATNNCFFSNCIFKLRNLEFEKN